MKAQSTSVVSTMALVIVMLIGVLGCQRSSAPKNHDSERPLYLGNLDQKMNEIYDEQNKDHMNVCDHQWRNKALEISRVLEEKREAIEALSQENTQKDPEEILDMGPFKFIDDSEQVAGKDEWTLKTFSWSRIAKVYDWIKDTPKDPRWVTLNRMARGIVTDDEKRIKRGIFYNLSRQAEPMVFEIEKKAGACQADATCEAPKLSDAEMTFLNSHPSYESVLRLFRSSKVSFERKREVLDGFVKQVHSLASRYGFFKNNLLKVDGNVLRVPLNLSAFDEEGARRFVDFAEKAWNQDPQYSIKIDVIKDSSPAYVVQVDLSVGGRAFVNTEKHVVQLFNWGRIKTMTHEFGHVLGFKDNYYTSWSTDTCSYTVETNSGDLMSESANGVVLTKHWDKLKQIYWP